MIPHTKALKVFSVPSFSGQGGLSAAPARAVSAVKNMNLPEIPRNINIGDINIKVPSLSPFWTAFPLSSAGLVHYWYSPSPPSSLVKTENAVLFIFNKCTINPHKFTFTFFPVCMGGKLLVIFDVCCIHVTDYLEDLHNDTRFDSRKHYACCYYICTVVCGDFGAARFSFLF